MLKNWYKIQCTQPPQEVCFKQTVLNFTLVVGVFTYFLIGQMFFCVIDNKSYLECVHIQEGQDVTVLALICHFDLYMHSMCFCYSET